MEVGTTINHSKRRGSPRFDIGGRNVSKRIFAVVFVMSLSVVLACSDDETSVVVSSTAASQPTTSASTQPPPTEVTTSITTSSTTTEAPSPTTTSGSQESTPARAIAPLSVDDPEVFLSEISEEERSCLADNDIGHQELTQATGNSPASSSEDTAVIIDCLQNETLLRLFLTSLVGLDEPFSPETSTCVEEGLVTLDLRQLLTPSVAGDDPVNSLALGMAALNVSVACMNDDEWETYAPRLGMRSEDREGVACLFEELGGTEELIDAMQKASRGETPEEFIKALEACLPEASPSPTAPDGSGIPQLIWSFATSGWVMTAPVVADGVVYFGSDDGNLYALSADSGELLWSFATGDAIRSIPAVVNGTVHFGSNDNHLYTLDAATGMELWRYDTGHPVHYTPVVGNGLIYFPAQAEYDRAVHAVDAVTGTIVWVAEPPYSIDERLSPTVHGDRVYAQGAEYGTFYAFDAATGEIEWQAEVGGYVESDPTVIDGVVYLTVINQAYAFNESTGELIWSVNTEEFPARDFPALVVDGVYYLAPGDYVYALDIATGEEIWSYQAYGLSSAPVVADGVFYGGSESAEYLFALDALTGDLLWTLSTDDFTAHALSVVDGVLYAQSGGYLFTLDASDPEDGSILPWTFETGGFDDIPIYSVSAETVYSAGPDNRLYAHTAPTSYSTE